MSVQIKGLTFRYDNETRNTIDNLTMNIEEGEVISIFGESGSGKSTILRLLSGLEVPNRGSIYIHGKAMVNDSVFLPPEKRKVGMVFQDYALFPHMTIGKNISFGLNGMSSHEKRKRVREVLTLVELEGFAKRYPHEISGGQQQRVALARAIAPQPTLLLLDEPFSNLDAHLQEKIRSELSSIIRKASITTIFVTHDKEDTKAIADRVIMLKEGLVQCVGEPLKIFV